MAGDSPRRYLAAIVHAADSAVTLNLPDYQPAIGPDDSNRTRLSGGVLPAATHRPLRHGLVMVVRVEMSGTVQIVVPRDIVQMVAMWPHVAGVIIVVAGVMPHRMPMPIAMQ